VSIEPDPYLWVLLCLQMQPIPCSLWWRWMESRVTRICLGQWQQSRMVEVMVNPVHANLPHSYPASAPAQNHYRCTFVETSVMCPVAHCCLDPHHSGHCLYFPPGPEWYEVQPLRHGLHPFQHVSQLMHPRCPSLHLK